jgi:hypothetical protein
VTIVAGSLYELIPPEGGKADGVDPRVQPGKRDSDLARDLFEGGNNSDVSSAAAGYRSGGAAWCWERCAAGRFHSMSPWGLGPQADARG